MSTALDRISQIKQKHESAIAESSARKQEAYRDFVKQWALTGNHLTAEGELLGFLSSVGYSIQTFEADVKAAMNTRKCSLMEVIKDIALEDRAISASLLIMATWRREPHRVVVEDENNQSAVRHWNRIESAFGQKISKLVRDSCAGTHADWTDCKADEELIEEVKMLAEQATSLRLEQYQLEYEIERLNRINLMDEVDRDNADRKGHTPNRLTHAIKSRLANHRKESDKLSAAMQAEVEKISADIQSIESQLSQYID